MKKGVETLFDLINKAEGKEIDMSTKHHTQRIIEHPTPTTYIWYMGRTNEKYSFSNKVLYPKQEPAYSGATK